MLYVTVGLGESVETSTAVLATVAAGYIAAAAYSGTVADRYGIARVIFYASFVYGAGLLAGGLATEWHAYYFALIFPVAVAGGAVMTQAWGLLFKLMPAAHRGAISGLATTTKGVGLIIGPILAGAAIDLAKPYMDSTHGYRVLWPLLGLPICAVIPLVWKLRSAEESAAG